MNTPHSTSAYIASLALAYHMHAVKDAVPDVPAFPRTRREYKSAVGAAVHGYLESGKRSYKSAMQRAVVEKFSDAFYRGYLDVGGEDTEDDDEKWLTNKTNAEMENVDNLFITLKALRDSGAYDANAEADKRAEGYTTTLDSVYSEGKLRGDKNKMLTFKRIPGTQKSKEPCNTCRRNEGKRQSARKWIASGLVERNGNENYECGHWDGACFHDLFTDKGERYTI